MKITLVVVAVLIALVVGARGQGGVDRAGGVRTTGPAGPAPGDHGPAARDAAVTDDVERLLAGLWAELAPAGHTGMVVLSLHGAAGDFRKWDLEVRNITVGGGREDGDVRRVRATSG